MHTPWPNYCKKARKALEAFKKVYHINQMISLTVKTLSGFHFTCLYQFDYIN